jgi:hypothetical protein
MGQRDKKVRDEAVVIDSRWSHSKAAGPLLSLFRGEFTVVRHLQRLEVPRDTHFIVN